jgi:aspartyl protease family protein
MSTLAFALLTALLSPQDSDASRLKELKSELKTQGVRVAATYVALSCESDLRSGLAKTNKLKRALIKAEKELAAANLQVSRNKLATTQLTQANAELNARLARISPTDVVANNKLVGMINTNNAQLKLLDDQRRQFDKGYSRIRQAADQVREDYVGHILDLRKTANKVTAAYQTKPNEETIQSLLKELGKLTGKTYELSESRAFQTAVKQLSKLEKTVLSESIPLRKDGDTLCATVVINGQACDMVVDSGATLIALPWKIARELKVKVKPSDKPIKLQLADGRTIDGTMVVLESVRVGGFVVEKVEAAILGPEARFASPLLGMSFLKNFQFEIKPADPAMTLVRVDGTTKNRPGR